MGLVAALEWLGQPYRLSRVDMLADMKSDAYGRLNDRRETPVLITDDGRVLTETMAIAGWLEVRDVERRISFEPTTPPCRSDASAHGFPEHRLYRRVQPLCGCARTGNGGAPAYRETLRDYGRKAVAERHAQVEAMVGDQPFLVGDMPTLADAVLIGVGRWAEFHEAVDVAAYPRLESAAAANRGRPVLFFALALQNGETPVGRRRNAGPNSAQRRACAFWQAACID